MENQREVQDDPEFNAMRDVYAAIKDLEKEAQSRVLDYVCRRLSLQRRDLEPLNVPDQRVEAPATPDDPQLDTLNSDDSLEGVSQVARKWMRRNGLTSEQLAGLFSLDGDEIDLIAQSIPGDSRAQRVRSVLLLQAIAAYLGSGAARVSDEKLREACTHYDAYDGTNFAKHLKGISSDFSGNRESGYTLSPRGMAAATELIRQLAGSN